MAEQLRHRCQTMTSKKPSKRSSKTEALILVVDDYDDGREMYADALRFAGFQVVEASNGHQAVALAAEHLPDLILMDLSLPGIDGWEATSRLKSDDETKHLRVIALTAHALKDEQERAMHVGCDGFITKPCLPDELITKVRQFLRE
jgi:two-component system, cell cycle response regulator DivK